MNIIEFRKLIKLARQQKGLTQDQMAETLSVTTSAISKWENGKNLPDSDMLLKLALTLGLSIEDLYYPEKTIERLSNTTTNVTVSNPPDASSYSTTKKHLPKYIMPFLFLFLILLVLLGGLMLHNYNKKNQKLNITQVAFRTTEDEVVGTVYEVACIYSGNLENSSFSSDFFTLLRQTWIDNTSVPEDIIYMKASFYRTRDAAYAWDTPDKSIYIVR